MSAGKKYDAGKAPVVQAVGWYFPRALMAVAQVSAAGAKKYNVEFEDKNWSRLDGAFKRYTDGLGRHLLLEGLEQYDTGRFDQITSDHCYHPDNIRNSVARKVCFCPL